MSRYIFISFLLAFSMHLTGVTLAAETVDFTPVRAPAKGPDNAPVTIIEIADYM